MFKHTDKKAGFMLYFIINRCIKILVYYTCYMGCIIKCVRLGYLKLRAVTIINKNSVIDF